MGYGVLFCLILIRWSQHLIYVTNVNKMQHWLLAVPIIQKEKTHQLKRAECHIKSAKLQRIHYNEQCENVKASWNHYKSSTTPCTYDGVMHYSFDYAQNIQYPCNPQQPGPVFFKSLRKCGLFGVSCEPFSFQVNYLIDEDDDPGKGSNATISMLHHFLTEHSVGEKHLQLHANNCVGQNKNNHLVQYLLWRTMTRRHESIELSFMIVHVGHTKFAPDRFFGVIKKRYKHTFVSTLD